MIVRIALVVVLLAFAGAIAHLELLAAGLRDREASLDYQMHHDAIFQVRPDCQDGHCFIEDPRTVDWDNWVREANCKAHEGDQHYDRFCKEAK